MSEWHITPDYIFEKWTDEEFTLMCEKLSGRKERMAAAYRGEGKKKATTTDTDIFQRAGVKVKKG